MDAEEKSYLWQHFVFNAEQRLKAFNFFVVFSVFANGGFLAAFEKHAAPLLLILIGAFISVLAVVFWLIDARSQDLLQLAVPGLKEYEKQLSPSAQLFAEDAKRKKWLVRYTTAFRMLFTMQLAFGIGIIGFGLTRYP